MTALRRLLALLRGTLPGGPPAGRPPRTSLRTGPTAPALLLRLVLLALCLAAGLTLDVGAEQWGMLAVVGLAVAVRPHAALLAIGVAVLIGMLALVGEHWWQLPVLALVTHAVLRVGALADAVSWRGRVELAVLRDALPGLVVVQAVAQAAAVLVLLLDGAAPMPWFVVVAVAALGGLSWAVIAGIRTARR